MNDFISEFDKALGCFPRAARERLLSVRANAGVLENPDVRELLTLLETDIRHLMIRLLPLASAYASVPVSNFRVGAIAAGTGHEPNLYFGANLEFPGEALNLSVHAEQSAVVNAWNCGETELFAIAASAAPCGYCRQFLFELDAAKTLKVLLPSQNEAGYVEESLAHFLPHAFSPQDLGVEDGFMHSSGNCHSHAHLRDYQSDDPLVQIAVRAAATSYAPYTGGYAGCALQTDDGQIFQGRLVENAAYNPSLSPLQVAMAQMSMRQAKPEQVIRAVLTEAPSQTSQRAVSERILRVVSPGVELEFYNATEAKLDREIQMSA